jgi:hypothetical protein
MLERAAWQAEQLAPDLPVSSELVPADLFEALARVSKGAVLLVISTDRRGSDSGIATPADPVCRRPAGGGADASRYRRTVKWLPTSHH